ncbi:hypothetical protein MGYG_07198 [Nannizzia gypsea CBS 118893]|uniref:Uncharacterized protein n=1 Tax=Arthroderma gypseum (strain ATCC MYA-4604 / CBS 118893) TaxID=535722 RepID=E4V2C6_ARTGP|nr:hypothetical protein MGYG_07198 [Nannizzia gypsea CBS 118893]EFR04191.1 hypothetical protein MGYG_07198 [Nannizzia gypsea CBS 118893]
MQEWQELTLVTCAIVTAASGVINPGERQLGLLPLAGSAESRIPTRSLATTTPTAIGAEASASTEPRRNPGEGRKLLVDLATIHARRVTIQEKDMKFIQRIREHMIGHAPGPMISKWIESDNNMAIEQ